jgi:cation diffusion facilitator family transporter
MFKAQQMNSNTKAVERAGWLSILVNVFLTLLNFFIAIFSGSLAVTAEMTHNLIDLVAAIALLIGLKLSQRKSKDFPYGLFKLENVIAVIIALLIFVTGYEIATEAIFSPPRELTVNALMLVGVFLSIVVPLAFSRYEMRVGREANSPSLIADAQEYRVHIFSSGIVLLALLGHLLGLALDRWAALLVVVFVVKTGWELLIDGMRVLLDASLDAETLRKVRGILESDPLVAKVKSLMGRNAGRYRFIEGEVMLRTDDLEKGYAARIRMESAIREAIMHVDRVVIHYEPMVRAHIRYAVPLENTTGVLSEHFGEAPYFALFTVRRSDGMLEKEEIHSNPSKEVPKAKGIRVAEWLVSNKIDVLFVKESFKGRGPEYVFSNAGIELRTLPTDSLFELYTAVTPGKNS